MSRTHKQQFEKRMAARAWYTAGRMMEWKCSRCGANSLTMADACTADLDQACPGLMKTEEIHSEFAANYDAFLGPSTLHVRRPPMPTSQYQISKSKREVKRLQGLLIEAEARQASYLERGARMSAEETGWRIDELKATIKAEIEWQEQVAVVKFKDWSPARLARHQQRHT